MPVCRRAHAPPHIIAMLCPFLPASAGPRQYYCAPRLAFPGVTLSTTSNSSLRACAAACSATANAACSALSVDAGGTACTLYGSLFNASAPGYAGSLGNFGDSVAGVGCVAANDPYLCFPPGWDVAGAWVRQTVGQTCLQPHEMGAAALLRLLRVWALRVSTRMLSRVRM